MDEEVKQYEEMRISLASSMEAQYNFFMVTGKMDMAYNILGKLMAYKLISFDDERVDPKNRAYKAAGIDANHRFPLDYRKDTRFIPEWLFADIPMKMNCSMETSKYWGKRVEGNYEGDIVIPERRLDIGINLVNTDRAAAAAAEGVIKMYAELGKKLSLAGMQEKVSIGVTRVYEITILSTVLSSYKTLGYVYLSRKENGAFAAKVLLKGKVLLDVRLPIMETYKVIADTIRNSFKLDENLEVTAYSKHEKDRESETCMLRYDMEKTEALLKKSEKEKIVAKAEKLKNEGDKPADTTKKVTAARR